MRWDMYVFEERTHTYQDRMMSAERRLQIYLEIHTYLEIHFEGFPARRLRWITH